jgi:hypothetical protein
VRKLESIREYHSVELKNEGSKPDPKIRNPETSTKNAVQEFHLWIVETNEKTYKEICIAMYVHYRVDHKVRTY